MSFIRVVFAGVMMMGVATACTERGGSQESSGKASVGSVARGEGMYWVYIGGSSPVKGGAIYRVMMDEVAGTFSQPVVAADGTGAGFLAGSGDGRFVYTEAPATGQPGGAIRAFAVDRKTGGLTFLNEQPFGVGLAYVSLDGQGKFAFAADYAGGNVGVIPIGNDGRVKVASMMVHHQGHGTDPSRQEGPHPHAIDLSPDGKLALACDLGLDKVMEYRFSPADGKLTANTPAFAMVAAGAGPRHLAFHPNGKFVYVVSEMIPSVTVFGFDSATGLSGPVQTVRTLPAGVGGVENTGSEIKILPSGRFLYVSNRGYDSIVTFAVDGESGKLTTVSQTPTQGKVPTHIAIDPSGKFLLAENQKSDDVVVFRIDEKTGGLTATGTVLKVRSPSCAVFVAKD